MICDIISDQSAHSIFMPYQAIVAAFHKNK